MTAGRTGRIARFGVYEADLGERRLRKNGHRIPLQDQPFQILACLLERPGELVSRDELKQKLWAGDTFVAFDDGLNTAIKKLRGALDDSPGNPRFIETVPRIGYRFIAPVSMEERASLPIGKLAAAGSGATAPASARELEINSPPAIPSPASDTGRDLFFSSRRLWQWMLAGLILLAAGIAYLAGGHPPSSDPRPASIQAIAVLPLQNISGGAAQDYLADGMTDEIITDLAKLAGPKIISRTSAMQYKGTHKSIPEIARELHVGAVVEGSIEQSADRMRVRVQLIDAATDQHIWAEAYDRQLRDVLQFEADLARDIAQQIQLHLTPQQQQDLTRIRPTNPQAFEDYLQGRQYWAMRTEESLHQAVELFNRALEEDPGDARSYAGLADCYIVLPLLYNVNAEDAYAKARIAAARAIELDPSLAQAHLANAEILLNQDWNLAGAEQEFHRTLELNPSYATGHQWYGEYLSLRGRHEEGIRELQTALALDPLSAIVHHQAGQSFQQARQYDPAIVEYRRALALNAQFSYSYEAMSWAYRRQGKYAESIESLRHAAPTWEPAFPGISASLQTLARAYASEGKPGFLRAALDFHRHYPRPDLYLARDWAELGDRTKALDRLEVCFQRHDPEFLYILIDPEFDFLRADARFQHLVSRLEKP